MNRLVLDLEDRRPIWAIPDWAIRELREALPADWDLHVVRGPTDGSGDGVAEPSAEILEAVESARIYVGFGIPAKVIEVGEGALEWVHSGAAGAGGSLHEPMLASRVSFTNSAGIHGPPIAETVIGMLLHFARGLDYAVAAGHRREWDDAPFLSADTPVRELSSMTIGILGYGGIGREVGKRARALGCRVLGLRRSAPDSNPDAHGVNILSGPDGLDELLHQSDALVVAAPDTRETRGLLTSERIRKLPRGAILVNVARGRILHEEALAMALQDGHLRGAGLDVFCTEPLPAEHPFWDLPNVLITPHISAVTRRFWRREMDLILDNLDRFLRGAPLRNEVGKNRGY